MQQLQNGSKEIDKTMELTSKIRHKLKECIDDICSSFSEVNILQRSLMEPVEVLHTHTEKLGNNVRRIDLGSGEVEKVTQEFFEKGSATEKRAYDLVKNIRSYQIVRNNVGNGENHSLDQELVEESAESTENAMESETAE